jgi:hypothetical protein
MAAVYDAAWLAPGSVMISADPTTTSFDPNPATCCEVFPSETNPTVDQSNCSLKDIDVDGDDGISGASPRLTPPPPQSIDDDACSTDTVAKDYMVPDQQSVDDETCSTDTVAKDYFGDDRKTPHEPELKSTEKPMDFISFLRTWNVSLVVRLNFANEPGMIQEYDASKMASYGIEHKDLPIDDHRGGMPDRSSVEKALEALLVTRGSLCSYIARVASGAASSWLVASRSTASTSREPRSWVGLACAGQARSPR